MRLSVTRALATALAAAAFVAMAILAITASRTDAYEIGGARWPGPTIDVYVAKASLKPAADEAMRQWNGASIGITLRRVAGRRDADVLMRTGSARAGCSGYATVGYAPGGLAEAFVSSSCDEHARVLIAAHELGHVLGLDHEDGRCALMNSYAINRAPFRCKQPSSASWWRNVIRSDDLRGARRIYSRPFVVRALGRRSSSR